jgi:hypothetical protein
LFTIRFTTVSNITGLMIWRGPRIAQWYGLNQVHSDDDFDGDDLDGEDIDHVL